MIVLYLCIFIVSVIASKDFRTVVLEDGAVKGEKYWNGEFYEFYGIPYARAPSGKDKFKAPLPVFPWAGVFVADQQVISCHQRYYTGDDEELIIEGDDQCLVLNVFVPEIAREDNLLPVVVYIHSGAYSGGYGNMARYHYLARQDIIVISINYRLGAIGFACLGNEDIPGNAAMKDQVAALRWINKNIKKFGGDPDKVTVAGFSVGAAMAELLALSPSTRGLIDKVILESASALAPFAINRDPVSTAKNIAISVGYNGSGTIDDLTNFYVNAPIETLTKNSQHFFLTNSTFGFVPCVENVLDGVEPFLTESPLDILRSGSNEKVALLTGFSNMEGLSRASKFDKWSEIMNENFEIFLPADLAFPNIDLKNKFINTLKAMYFNNEEVSIENLQGYIDYFSDSMFKYSILKSASLHAKNSNRPVFFYEFSYVGNLNMKHYYMDRIKGASHRDQTAYILEFAAYTNDYEDLDTRDRMTCMWADFIKYENPTAYESPLIDFKWLPFVDGKRNYLQINNTSIMKDDLLHGGYQLWDGAYEKYYWNPKAPEVKVDKKNKE